MMKNLFLVFLLLLYICTICWCKIAYGSASNWKQDRDGIGLYIDVDTSKAKFKKTPRYFTSLHGIGNHYALIGTESIYNPTKKGFRVYIKYFNGIKITVKYAKEQQWVLNWIGVEEDIDDIQAFSTNEWLKYQNPAKDKIYTWVNF